MYWALATANSREGKTSIVYMYDGEEEQTIDFIFKALSSDPWLTDDFVFFAVDGPEEMMTQGFPLPGVAGLMIIDEDNPAPRQFHLKGL